MWFPSDDGYFAVQSQEHVAKAQMAIAAAVANATAANATGNHATHSFFFTKSDDAQDQMLVVGVVALGLAFWLVLCGLCRCYVCIPCPFCFCYIPCCCGFCLKKEEKDRNQFDYHHHHHHQLGGVGDARYYPGGGSNHARRDRSHVPAYSLLTVDVEEPLLGPPEYSQPPRYEPSPPAYHNVPTAPPLS